MDHIANDRILVFNIDAVFSSGTFIGGNASMQAQGTSKY